MQFSVQAAVQPVQPVHGDRQSMQSAVHPPVHPAVQSDVQSRVQSDVQSAVQSASQSSSSPPQATGPPKYKRAPPKRAVPKQVAEPARNSRRETALFSEVVWSSFPLIVVSPPMVATVLVGEEYAIGSGRGREG